APSAYLVSPLTTVDIPVQRDGRRSFELLLKLIRGETKKISEKSEVSLVIRKSG
ncbi:MAG: substrate-binding domain-containing protein, partial [Spirochaetia bacterium]|nr:substrate-binding domain-containing protein [Spirochaetia bacterium]